MRLILFILSFFKGSLDLKDYPIRYRQPIVRTEDTVRVFPWQASVAGWWDLTGQGTTREEAYDQLNMKFTIIRDARENLPRPGMPAYMDYEGYSVMKRMEAVAIDFYRSVLAMEYKETDYTPSLSLNSYYEGFLTRHLTTRIQVIYGVDVSDLPGLLIADILKRVCFSGYFRHEEGVWVNDDSAENLRAENPQANDTQWSQQLMEAWEDAARQRIAAGEIREYSYKAVSKAHKSNSRAMLWILTTSMIAAAALGMLLLSGLAAVLFEFRPKGVYLVRVEYFYWMLPSMFIGLCASVPLYFWLLEKRTGMRIQELLIFERIVQGFSGWGLTKILLGLVMTGSLLFVVLGLNTYTRFDQDHIAFSELLEWRERRYSYREVEGIYAVSNVRTKAGRVIDAFHYVLVLTDGRTWSTRREDRESNPVGDKRLIEFVSMKSGVFIQYVDFYDGGIP